MIRTLDILLAGVALIFLSPLLMLVALVLSQTGEREVFYVQTRVGERGEEFGLLKFATMLKESPTMGAGEITVKDDPRVLPVGKFLRKSKINELPQLINIVRGDMSVIGPRPMVPNTFAKYPAEVRKVLNTVRPGLSGIGSVIFRDEEQLLDGLDDPNKFYDQVIAPYKWELEIWFVKNASVGLYLKLIVLTLAVIVWPRAAAQKWFKDLPTQPDKLEV